MENFAKWIRTIVPSTIVEQIEKYSSEENALNVLRVETDTPGYFDTTAD